MFNAATVRKDEAELCIHRHSFIRVRFGQIRPYRLGSELVDQSQKMTAAGMQMTVWAYRL
jgi:hypothetical protein